jgi:hypothetical protein
MGDSLVEFNARIDREIFKTDLVYNSYEVL